MHITKLIFLTVLIQLFVSDLSISDSNIPVNNLDLRLARDLFLIENYHKDPTIENLNRLKSFQLPPEKDPLLSVFLHFTESPDGKLIADLQKRVNKIFPHTWLPPVGAHRTGFMLARVKSSIIRELLKENTISRITTAYRKLQPLNDLTAEETRATVAWEMDEPLTGEGVRLVIIDSGFQMDHPDLPQPADTMSMMDYADWPDTSTDVTDHCNAHGTHVAGTAFGSGELSDGRYRGMAFDAAPVYFKIGNDSNAAASTEAVVGAIRGTASWADADIATMSYGGSDGFNDGSSTEEQAVDWAVSQGVTFFMSAGNSTQKRYHYYGTVEAGQTTGSIPILCRNAPRDELWELQLVWYDSPDTSVHRNLTAEIFDDEGERLWYDEAEWISSPRGTEGRQYLPVEPLPEDTAHFYVRVTNNSNEDQDFHLNLNSENRRIRFEWYGSEYLILLPSTADSCISVAASTHRTSWTDFRGELHEYHHVSRGGLANFSAHGPRIDGVQKPDITAPGQVTISCRNTDILTLDGSLSYRIISNSGESGEPADYVALEGTSMSSPAAAGTAALILQADPDIIPSMLRQRICRGARTDENTEEVPNIRWGWGKIDVQLALEAPLIPYEREPIPVSIKLESVYPNPFNGIFTVEYSIRTTGFVKFLLFDQMGREVWSDRQFVVSPGRHFWSAGEVLGDAASGAYLLQAGGETGWSSVRVVLVK